jgi:hypothetical protein
MSKFLKFTGFEAEVELLGKTRFVKFAQGDLVVQGMTLAEAQDVLDSLATGKVQTVDGDWLDVDSQDEKVGTPAIAKATSQENPVAKSKPKRAKKSRREAPAIDAMKEDDGSNGQNGKGTIAAPNPQPKMNDEAIAKITGEVEDTENPTEALDLPAELTGAVKLRQILSYLLDNGFKTEQQIVEECTRIRYDVPVLNRIGNLQERITRTLSVMDMLPPA